MTQVSQSTHLMYKSAATCICLVPSYDHSVQLSQRPLVLIWYLL